MTTRDELREKVAAGLRTRLAVNVLRHAPHVGHGWINELSVALAADVLAVVRAELAEPSAAMLSAGIGREPGFYTKSPTADAMITWRQMLAASPLAEPGA